MSRRAKVSLLTGMVERQHAVQDQPCVEQDRQQAAAQRVAVPATQRTERSRGVGAPRWMTMDQDGSLHAEGQVETRADVIEDQLHAAQAN